MLTRIALVLAGALALGASVMPQEASAGWGRGGYNGHGGGWHRARCIVPQRSTGPTLVAVVHL